MMDRHWFGTVWYRQATSNYQNQYPCRHMAPPGHSKQSHIWTVWTKNVDNNRWQINWEGIVWPLRIFYPSLSVPIICLSSVNALYKRRSIYEVMRTQFDFCWIFVTCHKFILSTSFTAYTVWQDYPCYKPTKVWRMSEVHNAWWRHQMETFSALLALCAGNSPVTGEFPTQRSMTRRFDVFFDLRLNKWLSKHWWGWWFETLWSSLWRRCNVVVTM